MRASASSVPRVTSYFIGAALVAHLALLIAGNTILALSVLFGAITSAGNLLLFTWIVGALVRSAASGKAQGVAALAPLKFFLIGGVILFLLSRPWIHAAAFLTAHGVVLLGVAITTTLLSSRRTDIDA